MGKLRRILRSAFDGGEKKKAPPAVFFPRGGAVDLLVESYWLRTEKLSSPVLIFASCWMSGFWI